MNTHDLWFHIILIIVLFLFLALWIANAFYWNKLRASGSVNVSSSTAELLFWLNVIWIVVTSLILIWTIIKMFIKPKPDTLELAKGMTGVPPIAVMPTEQFIPGLAPAPAVVHENRHYVTSEGAAANIVTGGGVETLHRETHYV